MTQDNRDSRSLQNSLDSPSPDSSDIEFHNSSDIEFELTLYFDAAPSPHSATTYNEDPHTDSNDHGETDNRVTRRDTSDTGQEHTENSTSDPPVQDNYYYRPVRRSTRLLHNRGNLIFQRRLITQDGYFVQIPVFDASPPRPTGFDVWRVDRPPSPNEYFLDSKSTDSDFRPHITLTGDLFAHGDSDSLSYDNSEKDNDSATESD